MKRIFLFISMLVCVIAFSVVASAKNTGVSFTITNAQEFKPTDGKIFLPAYADETDITLNFSSSFEKINLNGEDGELVNDGYKLDLSQFKTTDDNGNECYKVSFYVGKSPDDYTIYKASSLPTVYISTSVGIDSLLGSMVTDETAKVYVLDNDGSYEYADSITTSQVRVRGNTTPYYAKKPLKIKLDKRADLFGMGEAKSWILLANYLDQSLLRNALLYRLASDMGMYASDFRSVDLYLDGEYQGVYLMCEKVQIQENRLNIRDMEKEMDYLNPTYPTATTTVTSGTLIDETIVTEYRYVEGVQVPEDITGGYLIELDNNRKSNRADSSYFITKTSFGENYYVIKSPEYCSKEQVEYIARIFANMEEAFASPSGRNSLGVYYTEYMDIDSFAYAYIIAELSRNYDVGGASVYFHKDADVNGETSKIYKGPLWDCDNTLGNILKNNAAVQDTYWAKNRTPWNALTQHTDFNAKVKEHFETTYDKIYDMLDAGGFIDDQIAILGTSVIMERARWNSADSTQWPLYYDGIHYDRWSGGITTFHSVPIYTDIINYTSNTTIGYLANCLEARTNWLVDQWDCDVEKRERVLNTIVDPDEPIEPDEPNEPIEPDEPIVPDEPENPSDDDNLDVDINIQIKLPTIIIPEEYKDDRMLRMIVNHLEIVIPTVKEYLLEK